MLAGSIRRMTDEYTGSADTPGIHRPLTIRQYINKLHGEKIDKHRLPVEISLIFDAAAVWVVS
jgi:hypothetical protein